MKKDKHIIGIIPARMASSRFPGKPLALICGIPMIGHVYFRSKMCKSLSDVYVATCDTEIATYIESIGGQAVMTADTHERATDRTAEAMVTIERQTGRSTDIVVMIQGDEPMVYPHMIYNAIKPILEDETIEVVNLMAPLKTRQEQEDPNEVKVVVDLNNFALYFSREAIPSWKKGAKEVPMLKQVCIMSFTRDFLLIFSKLKPTPLEIIESVDMMRALEYGYKIKMVFSDAETYSVDTKDDLFNVESLMKQDTVINQYRVE
ncbi:3-deoxy-D-manno-octulosonate cytidylyltransferase [Candidatus Magnetobacterium bavaricum]|uniref:3-deoxy-D-manno-octulosonate cytidylyltransferase n=1 Tax=Candidatus Magnetobacterium bavaricum TaxID=29290 RepID=A0A0F3GHH3_9BACT|nr:3-deoxy-D-manno-octulosonate cytidylyltransferase [Candidatus Magnetobacterium bavaricum]